MTPSSDLDIVRRAYAKHVLAAAGLEDGSLEAAFATIRREDFLPPGPWRVVRVRGYRPTPSADPVYLYSDVLVAIDAGRDLNNGLPSFHAQVMAGANIRKGDHVVHVGTGTGYFTAILAQLTGPSGRVTGIEFDPDLAVRASKNLASQGNIKIIEGDGTKVPFDPADVIYVNAGATRPAERWLDGLSDGGRLILPLTAKKRLPRAADTIFSGVERHGAVFRIERQGDDYHARWISPVAVYPCEGGRDEESEAAIDAALQDSGWKKVTRLYRSDDIPAERCWLRAPGWCLAYE